MESELLCPECGSTHNEPADARLGHRILCIECAMLLDDASLAIDVWPIDASIAA
jgi:hypothetical protein